MTNEDLFEVQVSDDKRTVWVHADDGSTVGRFSTVFGMDVHRTVTDQLNGAGQCLNCTHEKPVMPEDWFLFCDLMEKHYNFKIDKSIMI